MRRLFNFAAAVSLLLCVTTAALWVRSYFATEWICYQRVNHAKRLWSSVHVVSGSGLLYISLGWHDFNADGLAEKYRDGLPNPDTFWYLRQPPESDWKHTRFGFMVVVADVVHDTNGSLHFPRADIPYWFILLAAAVPPLVWWVRHRAYRKWVREGCCLACGYDLHATPDRCPECGASAALPRV